VLGVFGFLGYLSTISIFYPNGGLF
jgi:hypothetical protein